MCRVAIEDRPESGPFMRFAPAKRWRARRPLETHNSFGNRFPPLARAGKALSRRILAGDELAANVGLLSRMQLENSARWRPDRSLTIEMRAAFPSC
jgi:hypothetical protein